ncbi:putative cdp-alcohol phosphatidyltransferase protein [Rosellinia necatrix]|uniref:Putative cdp-alcohol phosphatidyltransferase protein n=1 Tax=Rosellinia necatrix TaxID=77044 RepID=A0A1W2TJ41_ROSNE|nr:putative cdp-alcohol phosphatidyltransferase protein [Rosellinia necatrix]
MPSRNVVLATATLLLSSVQAQIQYSIEPESVPLSTRDNWCDQERSTCPIICQQLPPGGYQVNDCDPMTLTYGCVCDNGKSPNLSEYSLTLPFFICQEWGNQCVLGCGGNAACASDCRENHPCGALNPTRVNETKSSTSGTPTQTGAASTSSAGQIFDGLGGDSNSDSSGDTKSAASPVLQYGTVIGSLALAAFVGVGALVL